jgi:hypothetical protein
MLKLREMQTANIGGVQHEQPRGEIAKGKVKSKLHFNL